ncbi:tetratricopeptide repeat protein [Micromonospora sp. NPDC047738]|uniref:AfsR/SARP family transcriptional regulator n=1 Tax=Micromonospora sp. NPDC047738 TaxID=3155741 RepID=UPI00340C7F19
MTLEADEDLYFRALGPLTVEWRGQPVDLGGPQRTLVLALLLSHANQPVSMDVLVDELWRDAPPRSYRVQLQGLVSDLRRRLAPGGSRAAAPIVTRSSAYLLEVAADRYDLEQFQAGARAAGKARTAGDNATAVRLLRTALALWRGPAFSGLTGRVIEHSAAAMDEARVDAAAEYADARITDGQLDGLTPELVRLIAERPLDERFSRHLMTVHSRLGRRSDALAVYRELQRRTVAELGIEPSTQSQELHRRILTGDPQPPTPHNAGQALESAYRHLPPDIAEFVGRRRELAALMGAATSPPDTAVPIVTVEGMAGVGKTRLAVHAAHRLSAIYPDGQFYVDLHGFTEDSAPADPGEVLESLLRLLGVPPSGIPEKIEARAAVFRDRLSEQRVLLVVDNAAEESQVNPLLPANPGCLVIVTSRRSLAVDGAHTVRLDVLHREESLDLLTMIVGRDRVTAEPSAADALLARCGHLPLAVAVAARRLRARPAWPISHLLSRLTDENRRLDELSVGGRAVQGVLALSYRALAPDRRRLFRLLGVHPGNDVTAASMAALVGCEPAAAQLALESLLDEHLVQQAEADRYQMHDLLREYAARRCLTEDTEDSIAAAKRRLLDWYVATTDAATRLIRRFPLPPVGQPPAPEAPPVEFADEQHALTWLDAEYANLIAAARTASSGPCQRQVLLLAHLLQPYQIRRGHTDDSIEILLRAETAARQLDDPGAEAHTLTELGQAYNTAGRTDPALTQLRQALPLHHTLGQPDGEGITRNNLALVYRRLGRHHEAIAEYHRAITLFRSTGDRQWEAAVLSNLSIDLHLLGRDREALDQAKRALALQRKLGGPGVASLENNVGLLHARLGRHPEAVRYAQRALALQHRTGSRPGQANALANLAFSYARLGRHKAAIRAGLAALDLARGLSPDIQSNVLNTLGEAYFLAGDHETALRHHRAALAIADRIDEADEQARGRAGIEKATILAAG